MNIYKDPDNVLEIKERIQNSPTLKELKDILDDTFPGWILGLMKGYSKDYPDLTKNWEKVCEDNNVTKTEIMLVEFISFEEEYSLIKIFSEILTLSGFCVRSFRDVFPCKICNLAIPQSHLYDLMKENGEENIAEYWRPTCQDCI